MCEICGEDIKSACSRLRWQQFQVHSALDRYPQLSHLVDRVEQIVLSQCHGGAWNCVILLKVTPGPFGEDFYAAYRSIGTSTPPPSTYYFSTCPRRAPT